MERKDWTKIGVAAVVLLVPGGVALGGVLAARRYRAGRAAKMSRRPPTKGTARQVPEGRRE